MKLSMIIVNDHHLKTLQKCVNSVIENRPAFDYEILITDNSGNRECAEYISRLTEPFIPFPPVRARENFSRIHNRFIPQARGRYILFFDADAEILPGGTLDKCVSYLDENPKVGLLTCRLIRSNGTPDPNCRRSLPTLWSSFCRLTGLSELFPKSSIFSGYRLTYLDDRVSGPMECAYIAFMMVRTEVFGQVGMMDEVIYKYGEDIDFSIRSAQQSWEIYYLADAEARHHNIVIESLETKMKLESQRTFYHLFQKHFQKKYGPLGSVIALILKKNLSLCKERYLKSVNHDGA